MTNRPDIDAIRPLTATAFAWQTIGQGADYPPPEPKRGPRYGADDRCWLCGGPTHGVGWPRKAAFAPTFTNFNLAAVPGSDTVCQPCVALSSKASWVAYADAHPEMGLKTAASISWRNYSHAFTRDQHECPTRERWRQLLIAPPDPPFLFAISTSGQKHTIFRGTVAHDRGHFPVQVEEDAFIVNRRRFAPCLLAFEALYRMGFSKPQIVSGRYHPAQLRKAGPAWRPCELAFRPWRETCPDDVYLAAFVAQREE